MSTKAAASLLKDHLKLPLDHHRPRKHCLICDKVIKDSARQQKGQDAVLCEGDCQGWLHRVCAGVTKKAFHEAADSGKPFFCHYCKSTKQEEDISNLKQTIDDLKSEIAKLKTADHQHISPDGVAATTS